MSQLRQARAESPPQATGHACTASVTVIVPCHNEVLTVGEVVRSFRQALPTCRIVVADNRSDDGTGRAATRAGAEVLPVPGRGKGRAVRRLTESCDSDVVVMVDGDGTYDASAAAELVHLVGCAGYDLVNVAREPSHACGAYPRGHALGNRLLTGIQRGLTGIRLRDILSGYKAMSRRFVTSFPIRSRSFSLEVEMAAHAVALDFAYTEVSAPYRPRVSGSTSKLSTFRDGLSILRMVLRLHRDLNPSAAFTAMSVPWFLAAAGLVSAPVYEYFDRGYVPRYPSLIVGVALFTVAMLLLAAGWILSRSARMRRDLLQLAANEAERARRSSYFGADSTTQLGRPRQPG